MMPSLRRSLLPVLLLFATAGAIGYGFRVQRQHDWRAAPAELQSVLWPSPRPVAPFTLSRSDGGSFSERELAGRWSLLYFGYLQCPDVCPTTLQSFSTMLASNETKARRDLQFVFVSVDPGNDTVERMRGYLGFFSADLIGLSGDSLQLANLAQSLGVMYAEHVDERGVRTMDHTTSVILVDPQGRGVASLSGAHDPALLQTQFVRVRSYLEAQ